MPLEFELETYLARVGLTEVPGSMPIEDPDDPGILEEAIEQAGSVLLATIGGLIVGAAFVLPLALLAISCGGGSSVGRHPRPDPGRRDLRLPGSR